MHEVSMDLTGLVILLVVIYFIVSSITDRKMEERENVRRHELDMEKAKQLGQYLTEKEYNKAMRELDKLKPPVANGVPPVAEVNDQQPKPEI